MRLLEFLQEGRCYVIAEMSANHCGNLERAKKIVWAAKESGADCLKIQTYTADTITLNSTEPHFRIDGGLWNDKYLYELYNDASTPWGWQAEIKDECAKAEVDFLSTPFDTTAVDFLSSLDCQAYKIASFELVDTPLIEYAARKGKPMIISCGMGSINEIQEALDACYRVNNRAVVLLKCCSDYPASYNDMNLATIQDMRARFGVHVGLSDHSMGTIVALVGVSMGAAVVEKHFCLSREDGGADSAFSMEPDEFKEMVRQIRHVECIRGEATYVPTKNEQKSMFFRRSLFAVENIEVGEVFTERNIRSIRPSLGLPPKYISALLGNKATRYIKRGTPLIYEDILR